MTTRQRHQNIADARELLVIARVTQPIGTPLDKFMGSAIKKLQDQMAILETLLLADEQHECGECGAIVENGEQHDCPAADWNDSSAGQYAANVAKVM